MSNKRPLTPEEKTMAGRMKAILETTPGLTQESVGAAVGVSQGQVWQWIEGRLPVAAKRAAALASALGIQDPGEISVAYREIASRASEPTGPSHRLKGHESQSERLDPWILAATHRAMREMHEEDGLPYSLEDDPVHFLQAYELHTDIAHLAPKGADLVKIFKAAGLENRQGASDDGRAGDGATGLPDEGTDSGKVARKVQRKKG